MRKLDATYRLVYDEDHQTRGSYSYETEAETRAAEDEEIANLESGKWVVLGCIVTEPCPGPHCKACGGTVDVDSVWGIVVDRNTKLEDIVAMVF